jgi:WD40 repeat protein
MRAKRIALAFVTALLVLGCNALATVTPVPTERPAPTVRPGRTSKPTATQVVSTPTPSPMPTQTLTPEPSLHTSGPYFVFFRQVDWKYQLVMMDADAEGQMIISLPSEIADILPIKHFDPDMKFVSPDGKWLAYYTGSVGDYGEMPAMGTSDLTLNLLNLTTGEKQVVTSLLSKNYPDNFVEAAGKLNDPFKTAESLYDAFLVGINQAIAWSPDGRYLAFAGQMDGLSSDLYVYDMMTKALRRLTSGNQELQWISWSPDGKWIVHGSVFFVGEGMTFDVYAAAVDGTSVRYVSTNSLYSGVEKWVNSHTYFENDSQNGPGNYGLRLVDIETGKITKIWDGSYLGYKIDPNGKWLAVSTLENGLQLVNLKTFEQFTASDPLPDPPDTFIRSEDGEIISLDISPFEMGDKQISISPDSNYWVVAMDQKVKLFSSDITLIKDIPVPDYSGALRTIVWRPDSSGLFLLYETDLYSMTIPEGTIRLVESDLVDTDPYHRIFMWTIGK